MRDTSVAWVETMTAACAVSVAPASILLQRCSTGDAAGRWGATAGSWRPSSVASVRLKWLRESQPIKPVCVLGRKSRIQCTIHDCSNESNPHPPAPSPHPHLKKYVLIGGIKVTMEPSSDRFHVVLHLSVFSHVIALSPSIKHAYIAISATQTWRDHATPPHSSTRIGVKEKQHLEVISNHGTDAGDEVIIGPGDPNEYE